MGFVTGFTGGVTVTLSLTYLAILAHQRSRQQQGDILRANARVLNSLSLSPDAKPVVIPPSREAAAALRRANFVETAKDRWNAEIEGAVRAAQHTDWDEVRESLEARLGRLWARAFGDYPSEQAEQALQAVAAKATEAKESVTAVAKSALQESKAKGNKAAQVAEAKAGEVATDGKSVLSNLIFGPGQAAAAVVVEKVEGKS